MYDHARRGLDGYQPGLAYLDGKTGKAVLMTKHLTEYLLCGDCEQRLGDWDAHLSQLLVQADGSFPWLAALNGGSLLADADTVARFAYSVVWRGSVCTKLAADLGPYERPLAEYILASDRPPPRDTSLRVRLIPEAGLQRLLEPPSAKRQGGYHVHRFAGCGAVFELGVGRCIPSAFLSACFVRERFVIRANRDDLLALYGPLITGTIATGKLAKFDSRGTSPPRW
jgi:hypothetical protein